MKLADIKRVLEGPYKAEIIELSGRECAVCEYLGREFCVYLMPDDKVEQLVFSYISNLPLPVMSIEELNEFHSSAHVARLFFDEASRLNLNAKLVGKFEDLSVGSFVIFLEAWMNDFDRILPKLHESNE